ncbi:MAG: type II toxin-antitoxin system RelE/ParE family toxin [Nocardioidaceae bacterium]
MAYRVTLAPAARRALDHQLPEAVAAACYEFILGALADDPYRVGKRLDSPMDGVYSARRGEFRVLYVIDQGAVRVLVVGIQHRRDAYRPR